MGGGLNATSCQGFSDLTGRTGQPVFGGGFRNKTPVTHKGPNQVPLQQYDKKEEKLFRVKGICITDNYESARTES